MVATTFVSNYHFRKVKGIIHHQGLCFEHNSAVAVTKPDTFLFGKYRYVLRLFLKENLALAIKEVVLGSTIPKMENKMMYISSYANQI